ALRKQPVDDLIGSPISTHTQKLPIPAPIRLASNSSGIASRVSLRLFQHNPRSSQAIKCRSHPLAATPATRRRIDNRKKRFVHKSDLTSQVSGARFAIGGKSAFLRSETLTKIFSVSLCFRGGFSA